MDGQAAPGFGLPTSVGELPFDDHTTAVEFMLETQPTFPTVPRLRKLGCSLMQQVASFIPGATVSEPDILEIPQLVDVTPEGALDTTALELLEGPFEGVSRFIEELVARRTTTDDSYVGTRIDVLGPVSTALALRSAGVDTVDALALGVEISATTAEGLLRTLRRRLGQGLIAVVLDEPSLIGAMHPTFPLLSHEIHSALSMVVDRIDRTRPYGPLLIGAHVPGRTDWSTVIASGVSMISTPVGGNLEGSADHLEAFLAAGGVVAWGAVPVDEPLGASDDILWRRISTFWCSLVGAGADPFLLRSQSLISTSDGTGHFAANQLPLMVDLVTSMATRVNRQAAGTRLSLGA